jgi:hypothetical protein
MKNFNKQQWQTAFKTVLNTPIDKLLQSHTVNKNMMQHIYSSDDFLKTLPWIEKHFGYDPKNEVTKGIVFVLGVATINQHFINYMNGETV